MGQRSSQIRLRGILLAIFWMAVCFGSFVYLRNNVDWEQSEGFPAYHARFEGSVGMLAMGAPFVAYQALFGRNRLGVSFGVFVLLIALYELTR